MRPTINHAKIQKQIAADKERRQLIRDLTERFCAQFNAMSDFTRSPLRMYYQESYWLFDCKSLQELRRAAKKAAVLDSIAKKLTK